MLNSQTIEGVRIMAGSNEAEVFDMDTFEEGERGVEPSGQGGAEAASSDRVELGESGRYDGSIELSRRAIPVLQVDEDVCSICLDEFVDDDPGFSTTCGYERRTVSLHNTYYYKSFCLNVLACYVIPTTCELLHTFSPMSPRFCLSRELSHSHKRPGLGLQSRTCTASFELLHSI